MTDEQPLPGPEDFVEATAITGDPSANPALDLILQLLDVGEIRIGRHDVEGHPLPDAQMLTVEVHRRTDGASFSAAILLARRYPPAAFKLCLAHLLAQGVDRVKRG